jgi:hypothetical protein
MAMFCEVDGALVSVRERHKWMLDGNLQQEKSWQAPKYITSHKDYISIINVGQAKFGVCGGVEWGF